MKIFLSAPFTDKVDKNTDLIDPTYRDWLEKLIFFIEKRNHQIISSHVREAWGKKRDLPEVAIVNDFTSIREADMLIAYIGDPPSLGVQMELGYASSYHKKIVILCDSGTRLPFMVEGLHKITEVCLIRFENSEDLFSKVAVFV